MTIDLIAIDMDGTLLNPQHEITPEVKQAITAARRQGVRVVLTTGRPYIGVRDALQQLGMLQAGEYCITCNGALVQHALDGACVLQETLSFADYRYFALLAQELGVHFQAVDLNVLYTTSKDISPYTIQEGWLTGIPIKYRGIDEMDPQMRFSKVMMVDEPALLEQAIARIPAADFARFTIMKSAPYYLEILSPQADKGAGVGSLAQHLGIAPEKVMALGDQANDHAMLEYAGIGVAMGNAIPELQAIAHYVTKTNAEHGVAHAIEKFVLQE